MKTMKEDCLSVLELLELRDGVGPSDAHEHLADCSRCQTLLSLVPEFDVGRVSAASHAREGDLHGKRRASLEEPDALALGQLWTAKAPDDPDWLHLVAVIGAPSEPTGIAIVAPLSTQLDQASDLDLMVDDNLLGYPHLISVWHFSPLLIDQLTEYQGSLDRTDREALRALYSYVVSGEGSPAKQTGLPLAGPDDPRRAFRSEQIDRLSHLWRPARELLAGPDEKEEGGQDSSEHSATLKVVFEKALGSPGWDEQSLLEASGISGSELRAFLSNDLDVVDQSDVDALAHAVVSLGLNAGDIEEPVRHTLELLEGGQRSASAMPSRLAARARRSVSGERRVKDLGRGWSQVQKDEKSRRQAIEAYWRLLSERIEELS